MMDLAPELQRVASAAAQVAVHETFRMFGVDIDDQEQVNDFRADLIYARRLRKMGDGASNIAFKVVLGAVIVGLLGWMWDGFRHFLAQP